MNKTSVCFLILSNILISIQISNAKTYKLHSPNQKIEIQINADDNISYAVFFDKSEIISPSIISLTLKDGAILGENPGVVDTTKKSIQNVMTPVVKLKSD
ncbi:glycoside hydrolase family 97 N-terminal domain-containing protein [candidate division KSB1 bacterium]|nr:glycoside hydrolase family 97 N-terminal domain-containing protein [candidate division KSB1 bacterium]